MSARLSPLKWLAAIIVTIGLAFTASPGRADSSQSVDGNADPTCLSCHENLYYLYDTGKWFCIAKAPMRCVNCHGGDPTAIDQAAAHQNRKAHPIINDDTTTCQQCHVNDCAEHVQKFDQIAGISHDIRVATSSQPVSTDPQPAPETPATGHDSVIVLWSLGGIAMLAACLGGLWLLRRRHRSTGHGK